MSLDHDIVRAFIKAFPNMRSNGYESLLEASKDYETIRETHVFLMHLAGNDINLIEEVNSLMFTWRADMLAQIEGITLARRQKMLKEFGIPIE